MTFVLGLTGTIASGKSTVAQMFAAAGVPVWSADAAVHAIYAGEIQSDVAKKVEELFPGTVTDNRVDRAGLTAALSRDPQKLAALEALVHPLVRQNAANFLIEAERADWPLCVLEIPLLFETENPYPLGAVAVTWCDSAIARDRALARPGMDVEKLNALLARQWPQEDKKARADFLIDTGTSKAQTKDRVKQIIIACLERAVQPGGKP